MKRNLLHLGKEFLLSPDSDSYINSIKNNLLEIVTTSQSKGKTFSANILIIEDNINYIFKYFKAFHKINPSLKVIACTKTDSTRITINDLIENTSDIKMVLFDYNLEEFPRNEEYEAKEALKKV